MNYFGDIALFSELSESDQRSLSDFCQLQSFTPGEVVFQQGDDPQALYIIRKGNFIVSKSDGTSVILTPGEIVGEMAFYGDEAKRNATVTSQSDGQLIIMIEFSIDQMMKKYPILHKSVSDIISTRSTKKHSKSKKKTSPVSKTKTKSHKKK